VVLLQDTSPYEGKCRSQALALDEGKRPFLERLRDRSTCRSEVNLKSLGFNLRKVCRCDFRERDFCVIPRIGAYSAVGYHALFRFAQVRMGGMPLPASWTLTYLGSPENSFSTEVSRSVVVLEP
jgi:hypothetical protein